MSVTVHMVPVPRSPIIAYRDDGGLARTMGAVVAGQLPPLPPAIAGAFVGGVLLAVGVAKSPTLSIFVPVVAVLLAGPGSSHAHDGRLDWLTVPVLRLMEYGFVLAVALAWAVPWPVVFALLGAVLFHHYDLVQRMRQRVYPPRWLGTAGLGWEGRMLVVALVGAVPALVLLLAIYLWGVFLWESVTCWAAATDSDEAAVPADAGE
ncbi:hypothetical protein GCM10010106_38330 [Thermopolyspora flexuosa]|jgi:hypothetical protein|uniref:DUF5941 domain-containing protein n=1 Tax=Thermopolyspora flexuosa TaxID=103836 RepID=A0A543J210_9ACTN|nr:DUF5941 domain-containing protein [Thermopolyspora flexuosa]TQM76873.1 hypothetical protein FHX40_3624 [Thermopolyspora flexuosa]GGM87395.1 hypothetical protein GCM10010106_38330 [Thermopolyspora flexuosa]